jgi:hypothetical protein
MKEIILKFYLKNKIIYIKKIKNYFILEKFKRN